MTDPVYRRIGSGSCGSIWALDDSTTVLKREDGANRSRSIENDQSMHRKILSAAFHDVDHTITGTFAVNSAWEEPEARRSDDTSVACVYNASNDLMINIPKSYSIIQPNDSFWASANYPAGKTPCKAYWQERIPSVPSPIRSLLIQKYCPASIQASTTASRENADCLIRTYLEKRRQKPSTFFILRNYNMRIDQMDELGLDTAMLAQVLARTLVHCCFRAHVDADDVEFVLAPATTERAPSPTFYIEGQKLVLWMSGFDLVRGMSQDAEGVRQAVEAFFQNVV